MKRTETDGGTRYAQALIERFGAQMLATARRYSASDEDAEDAYQRAAEIALAHRPTGDRDAVLRWLRTTTKHEALAIRRHRARVVAVGAPESLPEAHHAADAHQHAERLEQLRRGGEALRRLKPQETRALQLRAEGYSYKEICRITGWTYTKVNRCVTEGRQAFLQSLSQIESGGECDRLAPRLSALADGEATPADLEALRSHLVTCLACRARLREIRSVPTRVSALAPLAALDGDPAGGAPSVGGPLRSLCDSLAGAAHDRWTALVAATQERVVVAGERLQQATELATAQKAAAVAASAVALSGGGPAAGERPAVPEAARAPLSARHVAREPSDAPPSLAAPPVARTTADLDVAPAPTVDPPPATGEFGPELPSTAPAAAADQTDAGPAAPAAPDPPQPGAFER